MVSFTQSMCDCFIKLYQIYRFGIDSRQPGSSNSCQSRYEPLFDIPLQMWESVQSPLPILCLSYDMRADASTHFALESKTGRA